MNEVFLSKGIPVVPSLGTPLYITNAFTFQDLCYSILPQEITMYGVRTRVLFLISTLPISFAAHVRFLLHIKVTIVPYNEP